MSGDTFVLVEWQAVKGVDQYRLQRSSDYDAREHDSALRYPGTWTDCTTLKGVVHAPKTQLIVSELKSVNNFFFRLAVRNEIDGCWSAWSDPSKLWKSERRW